MARKENRTLRRRLAFSWISTVICISLVLLLVGVAALLLVNARSVSNYFKENLKLSVILVQDASEDQAIKLQSGIDAITGVRTTEFISREQGIGEMARLLGEDFLDVFETAPVPISIDVSLDAAYVEADSIAYQLTRRQFEEGLSTAIDLHTTSTQLLQSKATLLQCQLMAMVKHELVRYYNGEQIWTE